MRSSKLAPRMKGKGMERAASREKRPLVVSGPVREERPRRGGGKAQAPPRANVTPSVAGRV